MACSSIHPSLHPFSFAYQEQGHKGRNPNREAQTHCPQPPPLLIQGNNTKTFPGQLRDVISPICPKSALGPPLSGICPEHLNQETHRRHPYQMCKPPQRAPFDEHVHQTTTKKISLWTCSCVLGLSVMLQFLVWYISSKLVGYAWEKKNYFIA